MGYVIAFVAGFLIPSLVFTAVMATISARGEGVRPGYGDELCAWWRSRPVAVSDVFMGASFVCGALGVAAWHLSNLRSRD